MSREEVALTGRIIMIEHDLETRRQTSRRKRKDRFYRQRQRVFWAAVIALTFTVGLILSAAAGERKMSEDTKPTGYTGVGLDLISLEEFEKLQTGIKLLYDTPLYEHPPIQQKPVYLSDADIGRYVSIPNPRNPVGDAVLFAKRIEHAVLKANGLIKGDL